MVLGRSTFQRGTWCVCAPWMDLQDLTIQPGKVHLVREILRDGVTGSVRVLGRCGHHARPPTRIQLGSKCTAALGYFSQVLVFLHQRVG